LWQLAAMHGVLRTQQTLLPWIADAEQALTAAIPVTGEVAKVANR
jgi:hypothetical protein